MAEISRVPEDVAQLTPSRPEKEEVAQNRQEILEKLNPEKFVDDEGNEREVYTFHARRGHPVKVVFYSPEELPFNKEILHDKQAFVIGRRPNWREGKEWQEFLSKTRLASKHRLSPLEALPVARAQIVEAGESLFFVESNPAALLDLAFILGIEDKTLRKMRREAGNRIISDGAQKMLDQLIAVKAVNDEGALKEIKNYEGEALLILSLLGEGDAQGVLDKTWEKLQTEDGDREKVRLEKMREKAEIFDVEPLKIEELVAVHLTRFLPRKKNNKVEMISTFEASKWLVVRDTIHFALNHPVAAHMYGSWDVAPYAVIAPLNRMIELNGNPTVLNTVDTFFETSPGTSLKLPNEAWLVRPGVVENGILYERGVENEFVYKAKSLTPQDIEGLTKVLSEHGQYYLNQKIWRLVAESKYFNAMFGDYTDALITSEEHESLIEHLGGVLSPKNLSDEFCQEDYRSVLTRVFTELDLVEKVTPDIIERIAQDIEGCLVAKIKEVAIHSLLSDLGYESQVGGMWAWGDSWEVTHATYKLGAQLGTPVMAHTGHISDNVEAAFMGKLGHGPGLVTLLQAGEITPAQFRERAYQFVIENFTELSQKTRRMLYLTGVI